MKRQAEGDFYEHLDLYADHSPGDADNNDCIRPPVYEKSAKKNQQDIRLQDKKVDEKS